MVQAEKIMFLSKCSKQINHLMNFIESMRNF